VSQHARWISVAAAVGVVLVGAGFVAPRADALIVFGGDIGARHAPFGLELRALPSQEDPPPVLGHINFAVPVPCPGRQSVTLTLRQRIIAAQSPFRIGDLHVREFNAAGQFEAVSIAFHVFGDLEGEVTERFTSNIAGDRATGTLQVTAKLSRRSGRRVATCRSREVPWRGASAPGGIFAGVTANRDPVMLKLTDDGAIVMLLLGRGTCEASNEGLSSYVWGGLPVAPDGFFQGGDPYQWRQGATKIQGRDHVEGRITGDTALGSWRDRWTETRRDGAVKRCRLPDRRWSARSSSLLPGPTA
jgi:hypothetical protein